MVCITDQILTTLNSTGIQCSVGTRSVCENSADFDVQQTLQSVSNNQGGEVGVVCSDLWIWYILFVQRVIMYFKATSVCVCVCVCVYVCVVVCVITSVQPVVDRTHHSDHHWRIRGCGFLCDWAMLLLLPLLW